MTDQIQRGAIGVKIIINVKDADGNAVNLTGATNLKIKLRGDITTEGVTKTASFEGDAANGVLSCLTETGDIDVLGTWRGQAYYELGSFKGHTQPAEIFYVEENLD